MNNARVHVLKKNHSKLFKNLGSGAGVKINKIVDFHQLFGKNRFLAFQCWLL